MPSIFLKAQICVLQARGSFYSCSFPRWALCRYRDHRADRSRPARCQPPQQGAEPQPGFPSGPAPCVRGHAARHAPGLRAILATP